MNIKNILNNKKLFISVIVLAVFIVATVIIISVCRDDSAVNTDSDSENSSVIASQNDSDILSGDSTFLVAVVNDSKKIVFSMLADFKIYSQKLILTALSVETVAYDGRTYGESYSYGGINLLKQSVEETRNIDIDRFVVINRSGFSKLTELLGDVTLYVEEDFTYDSTDKTYSVSKGENEMGSDMLYTYITMLAEKNNGNQDVIEMICDIINMYIDNIDSSDYEGLFCDVSNCFSTDLTISDFYTAKSDIEYLMTDGFECVLHNNVDE